MFKIFIVLPLNLTKKITKLVHEEKNYFDPYDCRITLNNNKTKKCDEHQKSRYFNFQRRPEGFITKLVAFLPKLKFR